MNVKENMSVKINLDNDEKNILIEVNSPRNMNITVKTPFQTLHYVPLIENPLDLPSLTDNEEEDDDISINTYISSDNESDNETKEEEEETRCSGCYPVYMCNQLAHMDEGGCLVTPKRKRKICNSGPLRKSKNRSIT